MKRSQKQEYIRIYTLFFITIIVQVMLIVFVEASGDGIQIETSPQVIQKTLSGKGINTFQVKVTNKSPFPVEITPEVVDLAIDEYGQNIEIREDSGYGWGLQDFTQISPKKFILQPGEARYADIRLEVPDSMLGSRYGILYFAATCPSGKSCIVMVVRCGSLLIVTAPETEIYNGEVKNIRPIFDNNQGKKLSGFEILFKNTGNTHISASGNIKISNDQCTPIDSILKGGTGIILPGGVRLYQVGLIKGIPDGQYEIIVNFMFQGKTASKRETLQVKNGQVFP